MTASASSRSLYTVIAISAVALMAFFVDIAASAEPTRRWSDNTGKFQREATFLGLAHGRVTLQTTDGDQIDVPLKRLCSEDRRWVAAEFRRLYLAKKQGAIQQLDQRMADQLAAVVPKQGPFELVPRIDAGSPVLHVPKPNVAPLQKLTESELRRQLLTRTRQIDIYQDNSEGRELIDSMREALKQSHEDDYDGPTAQELVLQWIAQRPRLSGLPMRLSNDCKLPLSEAMAMGQISTELATRRRAIDKTVSGVPKPSSDASQSDQVRNQHSVNDYAQRMHRQRDQMVCNFVSNRADWYQDRAVGGLVQMLQTETPTVRRMLVEMLSRIEGPKATAGLAKRAVFDLSADNRAAAADALKARPVVQYRPLLLAALRYPWPAAAQHAAEALVQLDDQSVVGDLVSLLEAPNPYLPWQQRDGSFAVRELVRVNHLRNCVLCHGVSGSESDLVRGRIPIPGERLVMEQYYQSKTGPFVRADVTFLHQDFSVDHPVDHHDLWPEEQRFDYLVMETPLTPHESARLIQQQSALEDPNREAVLHALRELTGRDPGKSSAQWRGLLVK